MATLYPPFLLLHSCYRTAIFHYSSLKKCSCYRTIFSLRHNKNSHIFFEYNAHQLHLYLSFNSSSNPPSSPPSDLASSCYYIPNICFLGSPEPVAGGSCFFCYITSLARLRTPV